MGGDQILEQFDTSSSRILEYLWHRSGQNRGRLHDAGFGVCMKTGNGGWADGRGPNFGAVLTPQIHGSLSIFGSGAGKVVVVLRDRGASA